MKIPSPRFPLAASLLLSGVFALQAPIMAGLPASAGGQEEIEELRSEPVRALPMILHLTNGTKLRVRARQMGDQWELVQRKSTSLLPATMVQRAVLESTLLKEAKKLSRASSKKQPVRRAAYADWLASEGLSVEALKELDRLLKEDPELKAARDVIERQAFSLGLPETTHKSTTQQIEALVAAAIKWGPAGREVAAQQLSQMEPTLPLQEVLLKSLVSSNSSRRSFATLGLRRAVTGQHMRPLMRRAILDPSEAVRTGAALALGAFEDPKLVGPVLRAMGSSSSKVRMNASSTLGHMGYATAVGPLLGKLNSLQSSGGRKPHANFFSGRQLAYVQDFDVEVASNSAIGDPVINVLTEAVVLDVGVLSATQKTIVQERATIRTALSKLTGANPGSSTKHWMQWWDANGVKYQNAGDENPSHSTSRAL